VQAFYAKRNTMVDASCVQIKPGRNLRGDLELYDTTPHYMTSTNRGGELGGICKTIVVGYFHGITKL